jgi:hypothetical protein
VNRRYRVASESCGVDCGDSAFDGDAFYLDGLGEDSVLKAVGQDFQDVANLGQASGRTEDVHGFRFNLIDAHVNGQALWLLVVGLLGDGFLGDSLFGGGLFGSGFFHIEIIQGKRAIAAKGRYRVSQY